MILDLLLDINAPAASPFLRAETVIFDGHHKLTHGFQIPMVLRFIEEEVDSVLQMVEGLLREPHAMVDYLARVSCRGVAHCFSEDVYE